MFSAALRKTSSPRVHVSTKPLRIEMTSLLFINECHLLPLKGQLLYHLLGRHRPLCLQSVNRTMAFFFHYAGEQLPALGACVRHAICTQNSKRDAGVCVDQRKILLVEDNPTDEALLMRALQKSGIANPLVRAKDGLEAIHYLFAEGRYASRDPGDIPAIC